MFAEPMCSTMQNNSSLKALYTSFNVTSQCFFDKTLGHFIVVTAVDSVGLSVLLIIIFK